MREYETYVLDTQAHTIMMPWWERIVPMRSYVKGWKISPSHYINQDLATVWLDQVMRSAGDAFGDHDCATVSRRTVMRNKRPTGRARQW